MTATPAEVRCMKPSLFVAIEVSQAKWNLAITPTLAATPKRYVIVVGDFDALRRHCGRAAARFGLPADARVVAGYEAGRDGFWIARRLAELDYQVVVIEPSSIAVDRRARQAKTDRIDADKLAAMLVRFDAGDRHALRQVRVPTLEVENARQPQRELDGLLEERTRLGNQVKALLARLGMAVTIGPGLEQAIEQLSLPSNFQAQLQREIQRLRLAEEQIASLRASIDQAQCGSDANADGCRRLRQLKAVGPATAGVLVHEVFGWRAVQNRRELAALVGLAPTPRSSGSQERGGGISKAGSRRLRKVMVESAWLWVRYQHDSDLAKWFAARFGGAGKRLRRIGIVAVARKLLIAYWRFWRDGELPAGAVLKEG